MLLNALAAVASKQQDNWRYGWYQALLPVTTTCCCHLANDGKPHTSVYVPLCENRTSFTKLEEHNILHCRNWRRTEQQLQVTWTKNFVKFWTCIFLDIQADMHTDMGGEVMSL